MPSRRRDVLQALGALGLIAGSGLLATAEGNSLKLGQPAPPATLTTLDAEHISTAQLLGKVVILTFWATWCVPCREELPLLSAYARANAPRGLAVLGFSLDDTDNLAAVRQVARTLSFPVGLLGSDRLGGYGRIWRIPVNFTIDRQGRLIDDGWRDKNPVWTPERLQQVVEPLLAPAEPAR